MVENINIGFIGIGKMGGIIARSVVDRLFPAKQIWITDLDKTLVTQLCDEKGVNAASSIDSLISQADVILCAVPPGAIPHILPQVASSLTPPKWVISIAAGVTTESLETYFETVPPIVRVMPNIAASVQAAISVLTPGKAAEEHHIDFAENIFKTCGATLVMQEQHLNAVTGVSGSGPAYVALFVEALADAAVHVGLSRKDAQMLATHTVLGAAKMLDESQEHPAILKNRVTTPGGTTAAGLHELERGGLRATLTDAIIAATERAKQLGTTK